MVDRSRYVVAVDTGETLIEHLDGVSWFEAAAPPLVHAHWAQTNGWTNYVFQTQRCPCGAARHGFGDQRWHMMWGERPRVADGPVLRWWRRRSARVEA
jgi:hypothetical protein